MQNRNTQSGFEIQGRIERKTHTVEDLREAVDEWDTLEKTEKRLVTRPPEEVDFSDLTEREEELALIDVEPENTETVYNVTTDRFHEYFVDNLNPKNTNVEANLTASYVALGDDGASGTSTADTDLNNRTYSEPVTDHADNGKELLASTFVDSTEANDVDLDEIGLLTGDPDNLADEDVFLINHAQFAAVTKDNSKTVTFDVTLTFSDV